MASSFQPARPQSQTILITVPPAPHAADPTPKPVQQPRQLPRTDLNQFVAPRQIPRGVIIPPVPDPPQIAYDPPSGPGTPGSTGDGSGIFPAGPKPSVRPAQTGPAHLPSTISAGLILRKTVPVYPPIAVTTRTEGTVILAATISKGGTIENLRVMSGPPLLRQSALDAVSNWLYRPYLLNGQPVEVETTVNVVFTLAR